MKRRNVLIAAMLFGLPIMVSVTAGAQEKKVRPAKETETKKTKLSEATEAKKMKLSEAAKTKKIVLGEAERFSPAILLGKAKELELTESQQKQLVAIMQEMQAKTTAVLTEAQAAKVKTWKSAPQPTQKMKMAAKGPESAESQSKETVK